MKENNSLTITIKITNQKKKYRGKGTENKFSKPVLFFKAFQFLKSKETKTKLVQPFPNFSVNSAWPLQRTVWANC